MKNYQVRFLPEGGFNKTGAFIEYDGEFPTEPVLEYESVSYLRLPIACRDMKYFSSAKVNPSDQDVIKSSFKRRIGAKGKILPSRWGQHSLSFFGEKDTTSELEIWIHESEGLQEVYLSGSNHEPDLDADGLHYFFLEIHLNSEVFSDLIKEIEDRGSVLKISVEAGDFPNIYSTWSPSVSDGRVIKLLDNRKVIENIDDVPFEFWRTPKPREELLFVRDRPPVEITIERALDIEISKEADVGEYVSDDNNGNVLKENFSRIVQDLPQNTLNISTQSNWGSFWICFWLAIIAGILLL